jgi:hypothetical protein
MPLVKRDFGLEGDCFGPDECFVPEFSGWLEFEFCREAALEFLDKISIFPTQEVNIWSMAGDLCQIWFNDRFELG